MRGVMRLVAAAVAWAAVSGVQADVVNTSVKRVLDLTKHVVRMQTDIAFVDRDAAVATYEFALSKKLSARLAFVNAKCGKAACAVTLKDATPENPIDLYEVALPEALAAGTTGHIKLAAYFTRVLHPYPEEVTQKEAQLVVFEDSHLFSSPYLTETQTTKVKVPSNHVESYSNMEPVSHKGATITYGPYTNVEPKTIVDKSLRVHFLNHSPFLTVTNLVKEIEVSMWGRVSVEEVYDLLHTGAKLKGGFSRFDYTVGGARGASFEELHAHLPRDAMNVYYRDQIGNVTTSRLRLTSTSQELDFKPRFPIFGGWKTQWYLGYSVPTHSVLTHVGSHFKLEMDFSTSLDHAAVDDITVKVILPEGATNVQVNLPFAVESQSRTSRQTYLDTPTMGRPVLIINKKNVIAQHNVPFEVTFDFAQSFMLHDPLLLVAFFFAFFLICMVLFRCDLSLGKKAQPKKKTA